MLYWESDYCYADCRGAFEVSLELNGSTNSLLSIEKNIIMHASSPFFIEVKFEINEINFLTLVFCK